MSQTFSGSGQLSSAKRDEAEKRIEFQGHMHERTYYGVQDQAMLNSSSGFKAEERGKALIRQTAGRGSAHL